MEFFIRVFLLCMLELAARISHVAANPVSFNQGFDKLFGDQNVVTLDPAGKSVRISLDKFSGSGFISREKYFYSKFSAAIKLAPGYTAGVVATFYTSNCQIYPNTHDELDIEFLRHVDGKCWIVQTNLYGNGSVTKGREERYRLWFDPSEDFHYYTILWSKKWTVFYVDNIPIREIPRIEAMGGEYPSKPMSLYGTIWDGSSWATDGGKSKVNYEDSPFKVTYSDFVLDGCSIDPTQRDSQNCDNSTSFVTNFGGLTKEERIKMGSFRAKYLTYSYCDDRKRYPNLLPECAHIP
ncbi:probable xyloglucan endotransglucosylase/hydrolase protein 30 [Rutidosis leptorrhynchoides]|uniref:probable xyloglucan endotransglucosylase/hydrolase protein 30 n=1 Tax=Rutidosis leptorrhynchoides TaxID=125765 RepID=UPI003A99EB48